MKISTTHPRPQLVCGYIQQIAIGLMIVSLTSCTSLERKQSPSTVSATSGKATTVAAARKKPQVVVTHNILCDLTRQIAAETIDLVCLLPPGTDPHIYKLTPATRQSIETAQLIMYGGYNFEPQLSAAIIANTNPVPKLAIYELAVPKPQKFEAEGKSTIDPHIWHNANYGIKIAKTIAANLEQLVPEKASLYQKNIQKIAAEIEQIDVWIKSQITTIPADRQILFTTHDSLGYYATAYGMTVDALEGISTEEKPNAARAKEIVNKIKTTKVPTIYTELTLNPQLIQTVAKAANVQVSAQKIYADGLGAVNSPGGTYQKMLIANTKTIVEGLGGKYTAFKAK
jgi:manganese/iron transport system substrate-binding protein